MQEQTIKLDELCNSLAAFRSNAACINYTSPYDYSKNTTLTVVNEAGSITGECQLHVAIVIANALNLWGFVELAEDSEEYIGFSLVHPDKVEAISEENDNKIQIKFNNIAIPLTISSVQQSADVIYNALNRKRSDNLEPINHINNNAGVAGIAQP